MPKKRNAVRRLVIPGDTVLTPRVLTAAMRLLATHEIEVAAEALIEELDLRMGDPDSEEEPAEATYQAA